MAIVRILVDGYSLIHSWPGLAPGQARHSMAARDALIALLTRYRDAIGTPITIVFDGAGASIGTEHPASTRDLEVLYSKKGQTADDVIERATHRLLEYGGVLVVTDDNAERETVFSMGGTTSGCEQFQIQVANALDDVKEDLARLRRKERGPFNRPDF